VSGFALVTPKGKILAETFDKDKDTAQVKAYDWLFNRYLWPRQYWKQWNAFIKEAERRGWYVFPVKLRLS
jgi:hypothetical protein